MTQRLAPVAIALGSIAAFLGLVRLAGSLAAARPADELILVNNSPTYTLDPQRMSYLQDLRLAGALYEGLVRLDPDSAAPLPALAESWTVSDDGRTWTFRLRPDARWSSGAAVTAHDVRWAWMRAILPDTAARNAGLFDLFEGAAEFRARRTAAIEAFAGEAPIGGEATPARLVRAATLLDEAEADFAATVGIRPIDDRTLELRLVRRVPYLPDLLAYGVFSPVWRPAVEGWPSGTEGDWPHGPSPSMDARRFVSLDARSGRLRQDHRWARPGRHVGNGPYMLAGWRYKRDLRLTANPLWSRSDRPVRTPKLTLLTIEDENTALLTVDTGRADWLIDADSDVGPDLLAEVARGERSDTHAMPAFGTDFFQFNCRPELAGGTPNPFHSAGVRRAFVLAADRSAIVANVTRLNEPVMTAFTPPGSVPGYRTPEGLGRDVERARDELAAAGWSDRDDDGRIEDADGRPFPDVEVLYTTSTPRYRWMALALADDWERHLGVTCRLVGKDTKFYREDLRRGSFMIARGVWFGDYGDPTTFLDLFRSDNPSNDRGFADAGIDAALDAAAAETDATVRLRRLAEVERVLFTEHLPILPICQRVRLTMYDPARITGIAAHPRLVQDLTRLRRPNAEATP